MNPEPQKNNQDGHTSGAAIAGTPRSADGSMTPKGIRYLLICKGVSDEAIANMSGCSVRTIQRTVAGGTQAIRPRRAIAGALGLPYAAVWGGGPLIEANTAADIEALKKSNEGLAERVSALERVFIVREGAGNG